MHHTSIHAHTLMVTLLSHNHNAHFHTRTLTCPLSYLTCTHTTHTHAHTHTRTHAHTHTLRSDTCKTCDTFKVQTDAKTDDSKRALLTGEWDLHSQSTACLSTAVWGQNSSEQIKCRYRVMFDLEQSLATPVLTTNVVFSQTAALDLQFGNPQWENGQGLYAHVPWGYCIKRITGSRVLSPEASEGNEYRC